MFDRLDWLTKWSQGLVDMDQHFPCCHANELAGSPRDTTPSKIAFRM
jgi:hypothetical protein